MLHPALSKPRNYIKEAVAYCKKHGLVKTFGKRCMWVGVQVYMAWFSRFQCYVRNCQVLGTGLHYMAGTGTQWVCMNGTKHTHKHSCIAIACMSYGHASMPNLYITFPWIYLDLSQNRNIMHCFPGMYACICAPSITPFACYQAIICWGMTSTARKCSATSWNTATRSRWRRSGLSQNGTSRLERRGHGVKLRFRYSYMSPEAGWLRLQTVLVRFFYRISNHVLHERR